MNEMKLTAQQLLAIEALAAGRFSEAHRLLLDLLANSERSFVRGQCRYCGCTEDHACGIMVVPGPEFQPSVVSCSWADDERTICTNARCLERWRREQPEVVEDTSRLVTP